MLRCSHMATLTVCTFGCPLAVCAVVTLLAAPEAGRQVLTRIPDMTISLTFKATQRIRDEQIHVYGEVSDAQLLWWRRLAEREDVRITIDDVTILFNGDSSHAQNALIAKFRGDFLLIQVSEIPRTDHSFAGVQRPVRRGLRADTRQRRSRFSAWAFFAHSTRMSPDRSFFTSLTTPAIPNSRCEWQKGSWQKKESIKFLFVSAKDVTDAAGELDPILTSAAVKGTMKVHAVVPASGGIATRETSCYKPCCFSGDFHPTCRGWTHHKICQRRD